MVTNMIRTAPVMTIRKNLGEILNEVEYKHDTVVITRAGKPAAAIIDINLFQKIKCMKERFQKLSSELADAFVHLTEEEKNALIEEAVSNNKKKR